LLELLNNEVRQCEAAPPLHHHHLKPVKELIATSGFFYPFPGSEFTSFTFSDYTSYCDKLDDNNNNKRAIF
jgi:hypothetical protein